MRLKVGKMLPDTYLQFTRWLWMLTPQECECDLTCCVEDFYLFHENIIYILMRGPEDYNLERTTPNRCCNINGRCYSSGASHEKVNAFGLRSERTDMTEG